MTGTLPFRQMLTSSRLIALKKKPYGVRPIAIGETWLRIISKLVLKTDPVLVEAYEKNIAPIRYVGARQFGVLTRCGTEAVAHAIREAVHTGRALASLSLDFMNAYNIPLRERIAEAIRRLAPSHFPYFTWSYQHEAPLYCVNKQKDIVRLLSSSGVRQGDVLAPLWYCMATRCILDQLEDEFPLVEVYAYIDNIDILILAPPCSTDAELNIDHEAVPYQEPDKFVHQTVSRILQSVSETAATIGARLQPHKCSLFSLNPEHVSRCHDLGLQISTEGSVILGTPVGSDNYVSAQVNQSLSSYGQRLINALLAVDIPAQDKMLLLRHCISNTPMHLARTISLTNTPTQQIFGEWDQAISQALSEILHHDVIPSTLIDLPIRVGGFGLRSMSKLCPIAFSASLLQANAVLTQQTESFISCSLSTVNRIRPFAYEILNRFPPEPEEAALPLADLQLQLGSQTIPLCSLPPREDNGIQSALMFHRDNDESAIFREALSQRLAPLFADNRACSVWLNVHPSNSTYEIPDREYLTLARTRALYSPIMGTDSCPLCHLCAPAANHIYTCRRFGEWRLARHNHQVRILRSVCPPGTGHEVILDCSPSFSSSSSSSPSSSSSSSYLTPSPTAGNLIADLLLRQGNRLTVIDVTIVATRQMHVHHTDAEARAFRSKTTKYRPAVLNGVIQDVIPFVVGPFGNIGKAGTSFLATLSMSEPVRLRMRLSLGAARATSRIILAWLSLGERLRRS